MRVSVLIPVYNRESYLRRCLNSVVNQTHKDIDILIWNDGSVDGSERIAKSYNDDRIRVFNSPHKGVAHARNKLLDACETEYAVWVDSDDEVHHRLIERQLAFSDGGITRCSYIKADGYPVQLSGEIKSVTPRECPIWTLFFRVDDAPEFHERATFAGSDIVWRDLMFRNLGLKKFPKCSDEALYFYYMRHQDRIGAQKRLPKNRKKHQETLTEIQKFRKMMNI
jgi:glycosyltransferase involved in cell wall biosynthesis